jgi:AcrR family transcriptional regulator
VILAAARASFSERGFERATMRDIAARAGVDSALVHHYFGTKQQLFLAAMEFPVDFATIVPALLAGPADQLGERFIRFFLGLWEAPTSQPLLLGVLRSAMTDPVAAAMLRPLVSEGPVLALAGAIDRPDAALRAELIGSHLLGLAVVRYVVGAEPLASASPDDLARAVGPTIERYLTGELG